MSWKQIVILGGRTGGTMTANRLRRPFDPDEVEIHVVDHDDGTSTSRVCSSSRSGSRSWTRSCGG